MDSNVLLSTHLTFSQLKNKQTSSIESNSVLKLSFVSMLDMMDVSGYYSLYSFYNEMDTKGRV